jgi:hypothetical protein
MKKLIKKILREEIDDFDWIRDNSISGEELRDLILHTGVTSIPFDKVFGDLDLEGTSIKDLGNLESVGGYLDLMGTSIKSLGNLESVGGDLDLMGTSIKDLGNLESVGGFLDLDGTPLAKKYSKAEIRQMVQVGGNIYM